MPPQRTSGCSPVVWAKWRTSPSPQVACHVTQPTFGENTELVRNVVTTECQKCSAEPLFCWAIALAMRRSTRPSHIVTIPVA